MGATNAIAQRMHCATNAELFIRFALWMQARKGRATSAEDVMAAFQQSPANAYRWLANWRAATGLPPLGRERSEVRNNKHRSKRICK